ncbi:hypothetical protein BCR34DRAFT_251661 [Clohesyomyces aquaticus]|uniref:Uncharacterized protein n=1 Tax=Clohesyomyces aquaticus TaxID=1231657 RepID=A0A1Y1ZU76_9PLEO|nr:hypothetical protein BCR34DRAFT_251661 [Clohesyomyces aquaticus]
MDLPIDTDNRSGMPGGRIDDALDDYEYILSSNEVDDTLISPGVDHFSSFDPPLPLPGFPTALPTSDFLNSGMPLPSPLYAGVGAMQLSPVTPEFEQNMTLMSPNDSVVNHLVQAKNELKNAKMDGLQKQFQIDTLKKEVTALKFELSLKYQGNTSSSAPKELTFASPKTPASFTQGGVENHAVTSPAERPSKRRHVRTETPVQMRAAPKASPGFAPQEDRALLADFFDDMVNWAYVWTQPAEALSPGLEADMCTAVNQFFGLATLLPDIKVLIRNVDMRRDLVAGVIVREVVRKTMSDQFLTWTEHPEAKKANDLFDNYSDLAFDKNAEKHEVLKEQKKLFARLKVHPGHHSWRREAAQKASEALFQKFGRLLKIDVDGLNPRCVRHLDELIIKAIRIGFRMRMSAVKWSLLWPVDGDTFKPDTMVNQSRHLFGNVTETLNRIQQMPEAFTLRFAMSPIMVKYKHPFRVQDKEIVHKAMAHLKYIGSPYGAPPPYVFQDINAGLLTQDLHADAGLLDNGGGHLDDGLYPMVQYQGGEAGPPAQYQSYNNGPYY